ncbi:MAG: glycosyltransferase family 4 protein [Kiritimatiellae bacterium]|nr:glycosyltransferase family 4 protein [Kiritimatiellia bacterium]
MNSTQSRCCILLESYYPVVGGMEAQGRTLALALKCRDAAPFVITRRTSPDLRRGDEVDGIPVYRCGPTGRSSRNRWFFMLTCIPMLIRQRRRYDVLLVSGFRVLGISALLIGKLLGKKTILKAECMGEMNGAFFFGGLDRTGLGRHSVGMRLFVAVRNRWLKTADAFVSMYSEMTEEFLSCGVPEARIRCIPNAVNPDRFAPVEGAVRHRLCEELGLSPERRYVVYTGRLVSYKGVMRLLRVWNGLRRNYSEVTLLLIGEGGVDVFNCEAEARCYVTDQQMESQVVFTGAVRCVDAWLKVCDLFILPTENDAFPICILEAMSASLGIITTPTGALKDVIRDGVTGRIIPAGQDEALRDAMVSLLGDEPVRRRLGEAARAAVLEKYTPEAVAAQYLSVFRGRP